METRENLWGSRKPENFRAQLQVLSAIRQKAGDKSSDELRTAIDEAENATRDFVQWLVEQSEFKTGPSGLGRSDYTW